MVFHFSTLVILSEMLCILEHNLERRLTIALINLSQLVIFPPPPPPPLSCHDIPTLQLTALTSMSIILGA